MALSGAWATGARLQEIVATRMEGLDPDELTAMELLALASPLPAALLTGLTTAGAVTRLEGRGLVETERSGGRLEVTIAQPLHAEVLRGGIPALRQQSMRRNLVEALRAAGSRRTADRVRLACWSLESGDEVDPVTLALGADAALHRIGAAVSARLEEILPDAGREPAIGGPAVPQDHRLAARLARAAYEQSGGLPEGVALASTLAWMGATIEAESVLDELSGRGGGGRRPCPLGTRTGVGSLLAALRRRACPGRAGGRRDGSGEVRRRCTPAGRCLPAAGWHRAEHRTAGRRARLRRAVGHGTRRGAEPLRLGRRGRRGALLPRPVPRDAGSCRARGAPCPRGWSLAERALPPGRPSGRSGPHGRARPSPPTDGVATRGGAGRRVARRRCGRRGRPGHDPLASRASGQCCSHLPGLVRPPGRT